MSLTRAGVVVGAVIVMGLLVGCINVSRPLVEVSDSGYKSAKPSTVADSNDTDEIKSLKDYAAKLEQKLGEKDREVKKDLDEEKDKRKKVEKEKDKMEEDRNYWKKRAEQAEEQLRKVGR
jgi:hypothetical protein